MRGEQLYRKQCTVCHGPEGGADGKAAYLLYPKPRDFLRDKFRLVSTTNMTATDQDIFAAVTRGMPGSAMPSWGHLSEADRWALVYYVRYLTSLPKYRDSGEVAEDMLRQGIPWELKRAMMQASVEPQTLIQVPEESPVTPEALASGQKLFLASCAGCHGKEGKGDGRDRMMTNLGYPTQPRDLTAGIYKGSSGSADLYYRMVGGIPGSPMPSYTGIFTTEQIWDLIHYVQSLSPAGAEERVRLKESNIKVRKINGAIAMDPADSSWTSAEGSYVSLTPLWWRDDYIKGVEVKTLHNGSQIAFYLKWDDAGQDNSLAAIQAFSDGAALQFSKEEDPPFFGMGEGGAPVYIWHWKSAWDPMPSGRQDIETQYPQAAVDWYPSQKNYAHGSPFEVRDSAAQFHDPQYLTGWGAGNPLSDPTAEGAAEQAAAEGLGSLTTHVPKMERVQAKGLWRDGAWHVIFVRSLASPEEGLISFKPGETARAAFAVWDGAHQDRDGQKMVSIWNRLIIEK